MNHLLPITIALLTIVSSCSNNHKSPEIKTVKIKEDVYAREPNDSASYKHLKYNFYLSVSGQLCEKKLVSAKNTDCNCLFEVYYDSLFKVYADDTLIEIPLNKIVDITSFVEIDSTEFSKDKDNVYHFYSNSDGGNRTIVKKADPSTFKRLCEYRWGIDKNYVFYQSNKIEGLDLKSLQILNSPDSSDPFVDYIKDNKNVYYQGKIVNDADVKTFKVTSGQKWDAEDKYHTYEAGSRQG